MPLLSPGYLSEIEGPATATAPTTLMTASFNLRFDSYLGATTGS